MVSKISSSWYEVSIAHSLPDVCRMSLTSANRLLMLCRSSGLDPRCQTKSTRNHGHILRLVPRSGIRAHEVCDRVNPVQSIERNETHCTSRTRLLSGWGRMVGSPAYPCPSRLDPFQCRRAQGQVRAVILANALSAARDTFSPPPRRDLAVNCSRPTRFDGRSLRDRSQTPEFKKHRMSTTSLAVMHTHPRSDLPQGAPGSMASPLEVIGRLAPDRPSHLRNGSHHQPTEPDALVRYPKSNRNKTRSIFDGIVCPLAGCTRPSMKIRVADPHERLGDHYFIRRPGSHPDPKLMTRIRPTRSLTYLKLADFSPSMRRV